MQPFRSVTGGILRFAAVAMFAWAAGTDAYGSEACPHHDAVPDAEGHDFHVPRAYAETHPVAGAHGDSQGGEHDDGPCTCITHCQAPGSNPPLASDPGSTDRSPAVAVGVERPPLVSTVFGPRHRLFELHLPNAPPLHA